MDEGDEEEGGKRRGKGKGKEKEKKWKLFLLKECYNLVFGISGGAEWNDWFLQRGEIVLHHKKQLEPMLLMMIMVEPGFVYLCHPALYTIRLKGGEEYYII